MIFTSVTTSNSLKEQFLEVRSYSEYICAPLNTEDYIPQPVPFASPPKWHLAHTSWFFEELLLKKYSPNYKEFHPQFSFLFNSYYNALGNRIMRENRGSITRPTVEEVYSYREYVNEKVLSFIDSGKFPEEAEEILILGLNHEQQHQELLITDLKHTFGHNPIFPIYKVGHQLTEEENKKAGFIKFDEGIFQIGFEGEGFSYDNEHGRHKVFSQEFQIRNDLVTNGEYLEFIKDGGYSRPALWHDEGWTFVQKEGIKAPLYWHNIDGQWNQYTLGGLIKVNPISILSHISYYEAWAFSEWKGMRLPTEFEWEIASDQLDWGKRWEWTNSAYLPYPQFSKAEGAIGEYNGKFMVNQMVLRGASVATSPGHSRRTYRNFFHPQYRWQYTGIRLAK